VPDETVVIFMYLGLGACFGWLTFSHRHLFSEGPDLASKSDPKSGLGGRLFWIMICTWLWPVMIFTGINTAWVLSKRKMKS
jgi:hypothetical protein